MKQNDFQHRLCNGLIYLLAMNDKIPDIDAVFDDDDDDDVFLKEHLSDRLIGIASVADKVSPPNSKQSASTSDNQHTTRNPTCLQS